MAVAPQGLTPKFDTRSRDLKRLFTTVNNLFRRPGQIDSVTARQMILYGHAMHAPDASEYVDQMLSAQDAQLAESRTRDQGLPYVPSRTFEHPLNQADTKDKLERAWASKIAAATSDMEFQPLYSYFFSSDATRSFVMVAAGDYQIVKDITIAGRAQLIEGLAGKGKSHFGCLNFEIVDNLKEEQLRLGSGSRLARVHALIQRVRKLDGDDSRRLVKKYEDEISVGVGEVAVNRMRGWKKILGLYTATGVRWVTTKSILPKDNEYWPRIQQIHDSETMFLDLIENAKADRFSILDFDEGANVANKFRQAKDEVMGFMQLMHIRRKFDMAMVLCSQDQAGQLPDELRRSFESRVTKLRTDTAILTVRGLFNEEEVQDVPDTKIPFNHEAFAGFQMNTMPQMLIAEVDAFRDEFLRDNPESEWTQSMVWEAMLAALPKHTMSQKRMASGDNPKLSSLIRLELQKRNQWNQHLTDRQISEALTVQADPDDPDQPTLIVTEERVARERKLYEEELADRKKRIKDGKPLTDGPDEVRERLRYTFGA